MPKYVCVDAFSEKWYPVKDITAKQTSWYLLFKNYALEVQCSGNIHSTRGLI